MDKMAFIHRLSLFFLRLCVCWSAGILTQHSTTHVLFNVLHKKKSSAASAHSPSLKYLRQICANRALFFFYGVETALVHLAFASLCNLAQTWFLYCGIHLSVLNAYQWSEV